MFIIMMSVFDAIGVGMDVENILYSLEDDLHNLTIECALRSKVLVKCPHGLLVRRIKTKRLVIEKIMLICVEAGVMMPCFDEFEKIILDVLDYNSVEECAECKNHL